MLITALAGLFSFQNCAPNKAIPPGGVSALASSTPPPAPGGSPPPSLPPTNGACSNPVTMNACAPGSTFVEVTDSATDYRWSCNGTNGGSNAPCSMSIAVSTAPVCGAATNTCTKGSFSDLADSITQYLWKCDSGTASVNCAFNIPASTGTPSCGNTINLCNNAIFSDLTDTLTDYVWHCAGVAADCRLPKPPGSVFCTVSVEPLVHFSETYTYRITPPAGLTLPPSVSVKIYGTKSAMNGSGTVTDANGDFVGGINPAGTTLTNTGNSVAGVYTRRFIVLNSNNQELCSTNTVAHALTPQCTLGATPLTVTRDQPFTYTANFAPTPALSASVAHVYWFGTFAAPGGSTVNDLTGVDFGIAPTAFPYIMNGPRADSFVGSYTRFVKATDSQNRVLCRSNEIQQQINPNPPPADPGSP